MNKFTAFADNIIGSAIGALEDLAYNVAYGVDQAAQSIFSHAGNTAKHLKNYLSGRSLTCAAATIMGLVATNLMSATTIVGAVVGLSAGSAAVAAVATTGKLAADFILKRTQLRGEYMPYKLKTGCQKASFDLFLAFTAVCGIGAAHKTYQYFENQMAAPHTMSAHAAGAPASTSLSKIFFLKTSDNGKSAGSLKDPQSTPQIVSGDYIATSHMKYII